jgi:hypothetical protein
MPGMVVKVDEPEADDSIIRREEQRREQATAMLAEHICEIKMMSKNTDFKAEARFYLSENDFDYRKAAEAYDKDCAFEARLRT